MAVNVRLFKLESSELKAKDFNYEISVNKARTKNWLIALSSSQVIDWIYAERGIKYSELSEMVGELKQQGKYEEAEDLLFMDELLQIDFGSRSDLDVLMKEHNGIVTVNGKQYKYLVSKGSSTFTYIREDLYDMISTRLNAGRNISKKLQPAKLSAYKSLAFTNSTPVTAPQNVIVIPDCEVQFQADYLWVGKDVDTIEHRNEVVTRDICDGCSFISPELAEQWSKDLGKDKILSAYQVRNLWTKGILFPVDYKKYCIEHEVYTIKDVWGTERNILMADLILTESMLKLNKGAYESMEHWLQACDDYGYVWRVAKTAKEDKWGNSNYQQFLPMELTEEDCREFVQDQVKFLKDVSGQNYESTYLFLNGVNNTERSIERLFNSDDVDYTLATALMIEPELINDKFLITKVGRNLRGMRNDMKLGRCMLDSNYQIIVCDVIALLEHLCGQEVKGFLKPYEIYSKKHMEAGVTEALAFRAPMLVANNIVKVSIAQPSEDIQYYLQYLDDVYVVDGCSLINESLCGLNHSSR